MYSHLDQGPGLGGQWQQNTLVLLLITYIFIDWAFAVKAPDGCSPVTYSVGLVQTIYPMARGRYCWCKIGSHSSTHPSPQRSPLSSNELYSYLGSFTI